MIRVELGHSRVTQQNVHDLLAIYQASAEDREALGNLARQARLKGWWNAYGDVLPDDYVGFGAEASSISTFESLYVPGLLQTEEYVRTIIRAGRTTADPDEVERRVAARTARKALLARDVPPKLWIILDEAAVRRVVGGSAVMRAQIARLIEACAHPAIEILDQLHHAHARGRLQLTVSGGAERCRWHRDLRRSSRSRRGPRERKRVAPAVGGP